MEKACPFCGETEIAPEDNFCGRCGYKLHETCPRCWRNERQPTRSGGRLCDGCGGYANSLKIDKAQKELAGNFGDDGGECFTRYFGTGVQNTMPDAGGNTGERSVAQDVWQ